MAIRYFCDRCGEECAPEHLNRLSLTTGRTSRHDGNSEKIGDWCIICLNSLKDFCEPLEKGKNYHDGQ